MNGVSQFSLAKPFAKVICLLVLALFAVPTYAQEDDAQNMQLAAVPDSVPEDFVIASLLISEPGGVLYSQLGHAAIRMQCPVRNLDYVFTYESEGAASKVLRFFAGKLKMGMLAIPSDLFISLCEKANRNVDEYTLNLPVEVRRNLWRVLDVHLEEGINLPYNYLDRGCAYSALSMIKEGLDTIAINYGDWPDEYNLSRREIGHNALSDNKWTRCFMHLVCNGKIDASCTNVEKVIIPTQLVSVLSDATVCGRQLLSPNGRKLTGCTSPKAVNRCLSPVAVAVVLLVLSVICGALGHSWIEYLLLALQTALGVVTVYLVFLSDLVCTEWSWLIIPFNPLPLLLWKWRRNWCLPYAVILFVWSGFMFFWPHRLTDDAYILLALSIAISYICLFFKTHAIAYGGK